MESFEDGVIVGLIISGNSPYSITGRRNFREPNSFYIRKNKKNYFHEPTVFTCLFSAYDISRYQ